MTKSPIPNPQSPLPPHAIRVLLVDDHPVVRVGLRALIEMEPDLAVVGEAGNGVEGVALVEREKPDVVVMDISMPEMDGLEATRRIRAGNPEVCVLILTVHAQERYLFPVLKAGAAGYVLKSTVDTQLIDAIRTVAKGGAFLYPDAARMLLEDYVHRQESGDAPGSGALLSEREQEVLTLCALGHTASQIGDQLALSPKTVETYRTRVMQKLELHSRAELVKYALAHGLLEEYM
ncbi:MAG: response regulator transcription factor [Caldilineaceae bacterium]|nr:response regulator transcription factor [Caldilineaceae bacterium]